MSKVNQKPVSVFPTIIVNKKDKRTYLCNKLGQNNAPGPEAGFRYRLMYCIVLILMYTE